jgi:hypothetical protein
MGAVKIEIRNDYSTWHRTNANQRYDHFKESKETSTSGITHTACFNIALIAKS